MTIVVVPKSTIQRRTNSNAVLQLLREEGVVTRDRITKVTGLSYPAAAKIVAYLEELGLAVSEMRAGNTKHVVPHYSFSGSSYMTIGVDLSRHSASAVCTDLESTVLESTHWNGIDEKQSAPEVEIEKFIRKIVRKFPAKRLLSVSVGAPGPIDIQRRKKIEEQTANRQADLKDLYTSLNMSEGIPLYMDVNVNYSAYREYRSYTDGATSVLYVTLSRGIGAGIVYRGEILSPGNIHYNDLGHVSVSKDGPRCSCGNRGCLENYAGFEVLSQAFTTDSDYLEECSDYIALAVGNTVVLTGIETIVIGGLSIETYPKLFELLEKKIPERIVPNLDRQITIRKAQDSRISTALGAASWAAEKAMAEMYTLEDEKGTPYLIANPQVR